MVSASQSGDLADEMVVVVIILTASQVVQQHRRFKKKPPPKLPAPPRKKIAADDGSELVLPAYIPPSCSSNKSDAVSCLGKIAPLQLYSVMQLVAEGEDGVSLSLRMRDVPCVRAL
jgi:hypothetical protein